MPNKNRLKTCIFSFFPVFLTISVTTLADNNQSVSALGRFEPEDGVIQLAAPSTARSLSGSLLAELFVKEGDRVKKGDLLATTDSKPLLEVALKQAQAKLVLSTLAVQASNNKAKEACIISKFAKRESERRSDLLKRKLASLEETEQAEVDAEAKSALCDVAKVNVQIAEAQTMVEQTNVEYQEVELQRSMIRAPFNSRILDILVQPGERIGSKGMLELGKVERMYAVAEVYETDIGRVKIGQTAKITSTVLPETLYGKVEYIHLKVAKQDVIDTDPAAHKDARIIEVEILLDKPEAAAALTYLQVEIVIETHSGL